ncbi:aldehyde dehydrogenase family protein [Amycolatopsis acidicola]|uniref:Aldehyde dehydrogenase family protein n=1 Tax=Amycolatopsis acidicola TaxID=2596893 RepID=A0A5N0VA35_9PSEU|nr:aldehyde dehydrogenase family protein [Amycolatopsis acidicola]KAA9163259.1 aldehyde dehydrogenase family protein [Amycolatopsis acidicola]
MTNVTIGTRTGYLGADGHVLPADAQDFDVENPATGAVIGQAHEIRSSEVDMVVAQAERAFTGTWRDTAPDVRGALLRSWADRITAHREELAALELAEVGHVRKEVLGDIDTAVRVLTYYAGLADKLEGTTFSRYPGRVAYGMDEPFGVVAGINAYNANIVFVAVKGGPALVAGNCIVYKAAEQAPGSTFRMAELALEAGIPPGVVSVVTGRGETAGPLLCEHPAIGMVSFTGSPGAGQAVIRQSASTIAPVVLELGGKSPAILLPDADLELALPSVLHSNFVKSGQSCIAGSRILVHESRYAEVTQELAKRAAAVRVGLPADKRSEMGTLISRRQRDHVHGLVGRAVAAGATVMTGGAPAEDGPLAAGSFYQPTVLADVTDDNPAATTEAFGPMASVLSYSDIDEALARANATSFGLSSQIWGNDARTIHYLAGHLVAGTVWVNAHRALHPTVPSGGMKRSGFGREFGIAAVREFTRHKSVVWDLTTERALPYT